MSIFGKDLGYSEKVIEHFEHPRNLGTIEDADASAKVGSAICGDIVKYFIKVDKTENRIKDIKFKSYGCASNIAASSILTEMVKDKTLEEAKQINFKDVERELGGLPVVKAHCAVLSTQALRVAIAKYEAKHGMRKIDEGFCRTLLQGVMDPITGENILEEGKVEGINVAKGTVTISLSVSKAAESAEIIKKDIKEAFKDVDLHVDVTFKK